MLGIARYNNITCTLSFSAIGDVAKTIPRARTSNNSMSTVCLHMYKYTDCVPINIVPSTFHDLVNICAPISAIGNIWCHCCGHYYYYTVSCLDGSHRIHYNTPLQ